MGYASGADFRETSLSEEIVTMYELLEALEETIKSAEPSKRKARADTFDAYSKDCPDDFFWAISAQSPTLLSQVMTTIDIYSNSEADSKGHAANRLLNRKAAGSA